MSKEALQNAGIEAPEKLPKLIILESPEVLSTRLHEYQKETERFFEHYNKLKRNYPEFFQKLNEKHPSFKELLDKIEKLGKAVSEEMTKEEIAHVLSTYNFYAEQINSVMARFDRERKEVQGRNLVDSMNVDSEKFGVNFSAEEKEELKIFAQDLWKDLCPESNVDRFMGWATGQDISKQGKLRWFFAPANGIEMAVMGFVDLTKIQTYTDLIDTVQYMYGMSYEEWCDSLQMLKLSADNLSTDDTVNSSLTVICSMMAFGGAVKFMTKLSKLKCANKLKLIIHSVKTAHAAEERLKPLPAAAMGGIMLKFADHAKFEDKPKEIIKGDTMAG